MPRCSSYPDRRATQAKAEAAAAAAAASLSQFTKVGARATRDAPAGWPFTERAANEAARQQQAADAKKKAQRLRPMTAGGAAQVTPRTAATVI